MKYQSKSVYHLLIYIVFGILIYFAFLWRLDGCYLWRDEATTACWAREMANSNSLLPKVWNGDQLIVQGSKGHDFNRHFLASMQGWLQFYLELIFFKIFGSNTFNARLPFTILGILGILLFFKIFNSLFKSKKISLISTFLCIFSLSYIHFIRQARYYALVMIISLAIIYEMIQYLNNSEKSYQVSFFIKIGFYGIMLFLSNYFTFTIFWIGLFLVIPIIKNKDFNFGIISTTFIIGAICLPIIMFIHYSFISRSEITNISYLYDYLDWFILSFKRINQIFPIIPFILIGIYLFWRYPVHRNKNQKVIMWLWLMILSTIISSVIINKSNAFLRYTLHVIPVGLILIAIYSHWIYNILGSKTAWIFISVVFIYHTWFSVLNQSEAVVKRQFLKDNSYNKPMVEFLKKNIKSEESVSFINNDKGIVAFFYLPTLNWYGILEASNPYNQIYKTKLPPTMFDDYSDIDWIVVWGVRSLPERVENGYELIWNYRYGNNQLKVKTHQNLYTPAQYTITQAEASIAEDLKYYDFYKRKNLKH
jgi:hypothetical protein